LPNQHHHLSQQTIISEKEWPNKRKRGEQEKEKEKEEKNTYQLPMFLYLLSI